MILPSMILSAGFSASSDSFIVAADASPLILIRRKNQSRLTPAATQFGQRG